jgi:hypothetical protein
MTVEEIAAAVATGDMLSRELDEDAVGIWKLAWHLRRMLPSATDETVQEIAEGILRGLERSDVSLGEIDDAGEFAEWNRDRAIEEAMAAWRRLARDPNIGEVAWLVRRR